MFLTVPTPQNREGSAGEKYSLYIAEPTVPDEMWITTGKNESDHETFFRQ